MKATVGTFLEVWRSRRWRARWEKRCLSLPRIHPLETASVLPGSAALQHLQSSDCLWEEQDRISLHSAVKLSFLSGSLLLPDLGKFLLGLGLFWVTVKIKEKSWEPGPWLFWSLQKASPVSVTAFLPFLLCLLLPGAGFLSHQTVGGLVRANSQCYCYPPCWTFLVTESQLM